jgi:hypothetical protein
LKYKQVLLLIKPNTEVEEPSTASEDKSYNTDDEPDNDDILLDIQDQIQDSQNTEHWDFLQWNHYKQECRF